MAEDIVTLTMVPLEEGETSNPDVVTVPLTPQEQGYVPSPAYYPYTAKSPNYAVPVVKPPEKVIVFDCETSGTNPWDYVMYVVSFWDLSLPVNEIVTFAGFDEEQLTADVAQYLRDEAPGALVCYNNGFDQRCLLSRFMLYQQPVPGWNLIKQYDMMDILKKGTTQSIASSQAAGSEEQWLKYFFDEDKPYTIEECFEGVREGDLDPFILRNRTCVAGVGYMYLLFLAMTATEVDLEADYKPTAATIDEDKAAGLCLVKCEVCDAVNDVPREGDGFQCWRCLAALPKATEANCLSEKLRTFDHSKVGLKPAAATK